jgi:glycosyltransferase involved in cell wall biosynthesis
LKKKEIVFLTPRYPFPLIGGDKIKSYNLLKHLAENHNVTLVALSFGKPPSDEEFAAIRDIGVDVYPITLNPILSALRTGLRLPMKYPLEISFYYRPDFIKKFEELCKKKNFDLGIAFFMRTAEYLKDKNFKKILISEDCRTLYMKRSFESSTSLLQKAVRLWEVWKLKKYEPEILNHFDAITLVTKEDIKAMASLNKEVKLRLVTNGVDVDLFSPPSDNEARKGLIFTGKLSVYSNTMMAIKVANEIMPSVHAEFPDVKLSIVGANAPKSVRDLENDFVKVYSDVKDISEYYRMNQIFIHPHEAATGIQNKLLEAMASELAVVTTPTGIQGVIGKHEEHFLISRTTEEMIQNTLKILKDKELALKLAKNARKLMLETHTWQVVFNQIDEVTAEIFDE